MNTLFFDTETTGLGNENLPSYHPCQPMPVQLGMKLDTGKLEEVAALNFMIRTNMYDPTPAWWEVNPKAAEITGINNAKANNYGVHFITAMEMFFDYVANADTLVAHNAKYDVRVMRRAAAVYAEEMGADYSDPFDGKKVFCTMMAAQNIVKALPQRRGEWKWPKLVECTMFFFNEDLRGAHDALVDVRACAKLYYHLHNIGAMSDEFTQNL